MSIRPMKPIFTLLLLLSVIRYWGQGVNWVASVDDPVEANTSFSVRFELSNAKGSDFVPPDFNGLKVVMGPSVQQSYTNINGVSSSSVSYAYTLIAPNEGQYTIGPAIIKVQGKTYKTKALSITAKKAKTISDDKHLELYMELDKDVAYVGEQVILSLSIYAQDGFNLRGIESFPALKDFLFEEVKQNNFGTQIKIQGNKQLRHSVVKKVALYPQKSGFITIEPATLIVEIFKDVNRGFGFFGFRDIDIISIASNALQIQVKPLPIPEPKSFTGIVGATEMDYHLSSKNTKTNEAVSLIIDIRTESHADFIKFPEFESDANFDFYTPKILEDEKYYQGSKLFSHKKIEYLVIPKKKGELMLNPELTAFDTQSGSYINLFKDHLTLNVSDADTYDTVADEIGQIKSSPSYSPALHYAALGGAIMAIATIFLFLYKRKNKKHARITQNFNDILQERLKKLKDKVDSEKENKAFVEEAYKILTSYLYGKEIDFYVEKPKIVGLIKGKYNTSLENDILNFSDMTEKAIFASYCHYSKPEVYEKLIHIINQLNSFQSE